MLRINIAQLITAIQNAPSISVDDTSEGLNFLHNKVYMALLKGEVVSISNLDFSAFDVEDIRALWGMHDDKTLKSNHADNIMNKLRGITPTCSPAAFV